MPLQRTTTRGASWRTRGGFMVMATGLAIAGLASSALPAAGVAGFGDVDTGLYYTSAVQWMVDENITTGTTETCFSPDDEVSRGQAAAFLWRMRDEPAPVSFHGFVDVVAPWQQDAVSWMLEADITTGTSATTFSPERNLTRGEMAALLWRLADRPTSSTGHTFTDVTAAWQQEPVSWLAGADITTGTTPTSFSPDDAVTRGQLATFLYRYAGEPMVAVDNAHPSSSPCANQVPKPDRLRFEFDQACDYVGSARDDAIVYPDQPGSSHLHDFFGVQMGAGDEFEELRQSVSTCNTDPANRSSYWVPAAFDGDGQQIVPERIVVYYRSRAKEGTVVPFVPETRMITDEAFFVDEPQAGEAQLFVGFPDCGNGEVDSLDHKSHMANSEGGVCPSTHPIPMPRITFRVTYPDVPVTIASGALDTAHADFFYGWDPATFTTMVDRCINESRDASAENLELCGPS